ncbi:MAG: hypothetical protein FJX65_12235 [Alphaproteobacteria bacterium]|nr:hypothetical protein [Alphaproteobacteria bacterium]
MPRRHPIRVSLGIIVVVMSVAAADQPVGAHHGYTELLDFAVSRSGSTIGYHRLDFRDVGEETHVAVDVELQIKLGFVTLFRYEHHNREIWKAGRLLRLETKTNDDGTKYEVTGEQTSGGLRVKTLRGEDTYPAGTMSATYWNMATIKQHALLDTQRGGLLKVEVAPGPAEEVELGNGTKVQAKRYDLKGDLNITLWYTEDGRWVAMQFAARGSDISYTLFPGGRGKGKA